jgi:hypothetical protein
MLRETVLNKGKYSMQPKKTQKKWKTYWYKI